MDEQKQTQLEIDLSHEVAQGTYANLTIIAHSTSEFIIDWKYEQDNGTIRLASENQQPTGFPIDLEPKGQA